MINKNWFAIAIIVIMFALAIFFQVDIPQTGDQVVTSVAEDGTPLDQGSRFATIFAMPVIALAILLLLNALPHIAVYRRNIEKFYEQFYGFKAIILLFLLVVYLVNILPAYGYSFNIVFVILPALAVLYFYLGHVLKHIHRNYFIGFLSPWALSSDKLWNRTHRFGGAVLEVCGVFLLVGLIFQDYIIEILAVATAAVIVLTAIYSYLIFSRDHHR